MPIGSIFQANAATKAATVQANAATQAAQLQHQDAQQALQFQQQVYGNTQQQMAPWLQTGTNAINQLNQLMGLGSNTNVGQMPGAGQPVPFNGGSTTNFPNRIPSVGGVNGPPMTRLSMLSGDGQDMTGGAFNFDAGTFGTGPQGITATGTGAQTTIPTSLSSLSGSNQLTPFTNWNQTFQAPTAATEQNDPGYQFRLQQGQQALENSAAARGGLLSGGTAKALQQYGQDYASNEYGNVYNRALGEYQQNYNIFQNNQNTQFNRLASLAGYGQTSAAQLGGLGQQAAGNTSNTLLTSGQQVGNSLQNAAAARASGYVGAANAYANMFGNANSNLLGLAALLG